MRTLYFDCFSGISGDMTVGALLDLGADESKLMEGLKSLSIDGYDLEIGKQLKNGIMGTAFTVLLENEVEESHEHEHNHDHEHNHNHAHQHTHEEHRHDHDHQHRSYKDIVHLIENSSLNNKIKDLSKRIFEVIAVAEGKIHGKSMDEVHFHEVGAVDSIIDIVGTAICIDSLNIDKVLFSRIPLSRGFVKCAHGVFPLPAPAVMEILKEVPIYYSDVTFELVTPTGAGIVKALGEGFGEPESAAITAIEAIGYGLGKKTYEVPNVLRAVIFNEKKTSKDSILKIETNIDDMTPEQLGFVMEQILETGALDVYFTNIMMKKNRSAIMLTVLCNIYDKEKISSLILKNTSTFGIRYTEMRRQILDRKFIEVNTGFGVVKCKVGILNGTATKFSPEYEDCKSLARTSGRSIIDIYHIAVSKCMENDIRHNIL